MKGLLIGMKIVLSVKTLYAEIAMEDIAQLVRITQHKIAMGNVNAFMAIMIVIKIEYVNPVTSYAKNATLNSAAWYANKIPI